MNNKITALITSYKRPHFLHRAVRSVLRQTYQNLQVCIFDDASGDETSAVIHKLASIDSRVIYHIHPTNIGSQNNFSYAFNSVATPYFSVLSDDDFLATDFYENAINVLDENPALMFVIMDTLLVDKNVNLLAPTEVTDKLVLYADDDRFDAFHFKKFPDTWTGMVFRKEVAQLYGNMIESHDEAGDMRFLLRAIARYPFAYLSKVAAFFTYHDNSFSLSRSHYNSVHHAIQASRYIDIIHDDKVSVGVKNRAIIYLNKMLFCTRWHGLLNGLKRAIKNICSNKNAELLSVNVDIHDAKKSGYLVTYFFLKTVYTNKIITKFIFFAFSSYLHKKERQFLKRMSILQANKYKKYFEGVNEEN